MKNFKFKIDGVDYEVSVNELEGNNAEVVVNGKSFNVELDNEQPAATTAPRAAAQPTAAAAPAGKAVATTIKSPLPGSIVKVVVNNGQAVKRGDVLIVMESMKMENNICAEADGTVKEVLVKQGQTVMQDDALVEFASTVAAAPVVAPAPKPAAAPAPKPQAAPAPAPAPKPTAGASAVKSPLPGSIIKVMVSEGQAVKRGDVLLTMESMKMENSIMAEKDGVVGKVYVQPGKSVMQDDVLLDLA